MKSYETSTTVQPQGDLRLVGVPFAPGTEVEVIVSPKRQNGQEFAKAWEQVCRQIHQVATVNTITDQEFQQEVNDYRAGR